MAEAESTPKASSDSTNEEHLDFGSESKKTNAEDFGVEALRDNLGNVFGKEVNAKDIFLLGKKILLAILILFIVISATRISLDPKDGPKEVWEFSKVFLSSIVSLVLGYYFGEKKK
jgi:hypothetical protein